MATASPAADGGRGRPWEGGLVSWPPAPPLTLPWTWMGPSWVQHPGVSGHSCDTGSCQTFYQSPSYGRVKNHESHWHWGFPALTEPSASPAGSLGIFEVRRVLDASGCSMLAPLQTGAARFSSYLLSRARKVLGSHLFSPCGVPEFCSISTRKLAAHGFGASMAAMVPFPPQRYHYFLVLDFEATCDKPQIHPQEQCMRHAAQPTFCKPVCTPGPWCCASLLNNGDKLILETPNKLSLLLLLFHYVPVDWEGLAKRLEIIEFPILKLNGRTMEIESTFHMYVQPVVHPQLTPFCTELTGIIQAMVDGQPSLQQVLERVDEWMAKEGLLDPNVKSIFVTCGDWDLKVMLPGQCQCLGLPVADYFKQWINLKKAYSFAMGCWPKNGLLDMNKGLSLQHIGRPHSGIDDCKNIANIMKTLAYRGFIFKQTSKPF
ncbi:ERI1 exoribonuclease 3 isoform X3 [Manis pentadactyla]|uniref:ERI1 exoribonuclease 3 isoform X3 n=1 Tax=Manis pentadactyla TaxID=143292 RepID=UPI00187512DF|nr:ERI1 exoribonuclease 3 isoform X3 [Manis pentadactyla]